MSVNNFPTAALNWCLGLLPVSLRMEGFCLAGAEEGSGLQRQEEVVRGWTEVGQDRREGGGVSSAATNGFEVN